MTKLNLENVKAIIAGVYRKKVRLALKILSVVLIIAGTILTGLGIWFYEKNNYWWTKKHKIRICNYWYNIDCYRNFNRTYKRNVNLL